MGRRKRTDFPGAHHHVMSRGARRQPVFLNEAHYALFLALLSELPERFSVVIHGFALMPNHFHLMIVSLFGFLSKAMAYLLSRYTMEVNKKHAWDGPLFRGRFHSLPVEREEHWMHLLPYLHYNPVRAGLVDRPDQWPWTSHRFYSGQLDPPPWLKIGTLEKKYDPIGGYNVYQENMTREGSDTPEGFTGVIFSESRSQKEKLVSPAPPHRKVKDRIKQLTPEAVLSTLAELAEVGEDLLVSKCRGRIGNPMKLVAAHLLVYQCGLKAGEAGYILKMTPSDVSKALKKVRERKNESDEIGKLIKAFEEEKNKKGKRKGLTP